MGKAAKISILLAGLGLAPVAMGDSFRCNGHIIEEDMTRQQVLEYCGPPDEQNNQTSNTWTYKRNNGSMSIVVYFYANDNVEMIESVSN